MIAVSPDGIITRAKVPSDGSLSATVRRRSGRRLEISPAARLELPDGFLDGWELCTHSVLGERTEASIDRQVGNTLLLSRVARIVEGASIRLVLRSTTIDAPRLGIHLATKTPLRGLLPPIELRLSTTRGTNALLEGRGARVGVLVSAGLEGVVEIGDQTRDDLFARVPMRPQPIATAVCAISERSNARGACLLCADDSDIARAATLLATANCETIVVSLAHALADRSREQVIAATLRTLGWRATAAADIAPHPRLITRTETATVHARLEPILDHFIRDARASAGEAPAFVFTSAGVLQRAERLLARDTLLSGPAGGTRAVAEVARRHAIGHAIGFDMGGTSSDVSRVTNGAVSLRAESRIGRATVAAPSIAIDSVAAGGGSICSVRDGACEVGPESAGANPGPACYGRGGPLALSDVNLLAGRFVSDFESIALERTPAEALLQVAAADRGMTEIGTMHAFLDIANTRMALAIENLCVRDGVDVVGHALIAFGGAGGQHACPIAERLGIDQIIFPRFAGFLCAQGVLNATPARFAVRPLLVPLLGNEALFALACEDAVDEARDELEADTGERGECATVTVRLRLLGQEASIEVPYGTIPDMTQAFQQRFEVLFGYAPPPRAIEAEQLLAQVAAREALRVDELQYDTPSDSFARAYDTVEMLSNGAVVRTPIFARASLAAGRTIEGPALILDVGETVVIDVGWRAEIDQTGDIVARRVACAASDPTTTPEPGDEVFAARLESIALGMGHLLERTALSPNIRDRLDFSCAILDHDGNLVQNAPHLPVHLGALGVCVRGVARELELREGDIAVTNHPAFGGSHLPDVTTVAPVFVDGMRIAYVAVRAHHAEIGGTRPGSFPPDARTLAEEGVVLAPFVAVRGGDLDVEGTRARFALGAFPSRNPDENLADLSAQIAATRHGTAAVAKLARACGRDEFSARCASELERASRALHARVSRWPHETRHAERFLDDGTPIRVRIARKNDRLTIDFSGSGPVHQANFNAPRAVTQAATLYALRLLIDEPVPMNEGLLRAIDLVIPEGILNPPFERDPLRCPPVVAGNVETSQSVVAVLLDALGLVAESQSTMNNVLFGNHTVSIYETLGGGAGAGPRHDVRDEVRDVSQDHSQSTHATPAKHGASAVHVHMSNTRLTDIDVLERRAPVIIREFRIRRESGGEGAGRGGDGMVRSYEFLAPISLSFFGSRRVHAPRGMNGGGPGACGVELLCRTGDSCFTALTGGVHALELRAGDRFTVETPGGGGFGAQLETSVMSAAGHVPVD